MKSPADIERRINELRSDVSAPATVTISSRNPPPTMPSRTIGSKLKRGIKIFGAMLGVLGGVLAVNTLTLGAVNSLFGLVPRSLFGIPGILLHPLLHANLQHLMSNAIGLVMLGGVVFLRNERDFWRVTVFGTLFGGTIEWFIGPSALHVGASGVVFAYLGYLLTTGWFDRKPTAILLSLGASVLWGSALMGLSPLQTNVSWQLHLLGLVAGVIVASRRRVKGR